jgi:predicted 3-demethylubiquinone-9 3-methyltransferase (glyoxalase superfamily)
MVQMSKIYPCLWFDGQAEEAANFYVSIFPDSRVDSVDLSPTDYPSGKEGDIITVEFTLAGQQFMALNGGPEFKFNEAVSFVVECDDQAEVDRYWDALLAGGGKPVQCGWLTDKYGLSWQVNPRRLTELLKDPDRGKAKRAMEAMMHMVKLDIAELERAAAGG